MLLRLLASLASISSRVCRDPSLSVAILRSSTKRVCRSNSVPSRPANQGGCLAANNPACGAGEFRQSPGQSGTPDNVAPERQSKKTPKLAGQHEQGQPSLFPDDPCPWTFGTTGHSTRLCGERKGTAVSLPLAGAGRLAMILWHLGLDGISLGVRAICVRCTLDTNLHGDSGARLAGNRTVNTTRERVGYSPDGASQDERRIATDDLGKTTDIRCCSRAKATKRTPWTTKMNRRHSR